MIDRSAYVWLVLGEPFDLDVAVEQLTRLYCNALGLPYHRDVDGPAAAPSTGGGQSLIAVVNDRRDSAPNGGSMFLNDVVRLNGRKYPDRPAIVAGDRTTTFGELRDAAWQVANAMRELGQPGDRVGILAENLPEYVECYYGVPAAGMALTFLNYRLHPKEWAWILEQRRGQRAARAGQVPRADRAAARRRGADRRSTSS